MTTGPGAEPSAESLSLQQGTLRRAALLGGAILALVGVVAWYGFHRDAPSPLDRYARLSPSAAAAALKRDLAAEFPPGTPITPLVQRLQGIGMACLPGGEGRAQWECGITLMTEDRRPVQLRASIGILGDRIVTLETAAGERPR
ncbi:hypothetical protein JMJ55_11880 [Belnapia sp. T6]|uniref:Uncharacterized protein n=1 Tax=Belnapia mucosa TaxID=2804532 RepID=A0ABS1V387_9PROT|nr:hypothetical protein [Belnapia mucosa]MBL6456027.1 hypothetical protein [Belnapia mucosa]